MTVDTAVQLTQDFSEQQFENPGSANHPFLCQRPCRFHAVGKCSSGKKCSYCHLPHRDHIARPDKRNRERLKEMPFNSAVRVVLSILREKAARLKSGEETLDAIYRLTPLDYQGPSYQSVATLPISSRTANYQVTKCGAPVEAPVSFEEHMAQARLAFEQSLLLALEKKSNPVDPHTNSDQVDDIFQVHSAVRIADIDEPSPDPQLACSNDALDHFLNLLAALEAKSNKEGSTSRTCTDSEKSRTKLRTSLQSMGLKPLVMWLRRMTPAHAAEERMLISRLLPTLLGTGANLEAGYDPMPNAAMYDNTWPNSGALPLVAPNSEADTADNPSSDTGSTTASALSS